MDLKKILGDAYNADVEKAINEAVSKDYVTRTDFNEKNEGLKAARATICTECGEKRDSR